MKKVVKILSKCLLLFLLILPALFIQFASHSDIVIGLTSLIQTHLLLSIFLLLLLKVFSVIYPPMPGIVFTLATIPILGWKTAYAIDFVGSAIGTTSSYYLGKKFGSAILKKIVGKSLANKILAIKLKQKNQIEATVFIRFASGGVLSDGLAWGANLIGFQYVPFITGYSICHLITTLPVFYFVAASISLDSWVVFAAAMVIAWLVIFKFKGRYFE